MAYRLERRVQGKRVSAHFLRQRLRSSAPRLLALPAYRQLDGHSCGFLAVLTVVRHFAPHVRPEEVLAAVRPSPSSGCSQRGVVTALRRFGVTAEYREGLGLRRLHRLTRNGTPVIVTVWPEEYGCDHWAAVRGVDLRNGRVFLTNYEYTDADGGMPWRVFAVHRFPRGGGIVCTFSGGE
jgi:hypothetical protein